MREDQRVAFVGDDDLPPGHDWVYVALDDGRDCVFIRESAVSPRLLCEAWNAIGAGRRGTSTAA